MEPETMEPETLLTVRQVACRLQQTIGTVYHHVYSGRLPAVRTPTGSIRVRESDLAAFLEPIKPRDSSEEGGG